MSSPFFLALPGCDPATAHTVCDRARRLIGEQHWNPITTGLPVTVSVGHATAHPTSTMSSLLGAADAALYDAKHAGRDQVWPKPTRSQAPR